MIVPSSQRETDYSWLLAALKFRNEVNVCVYVQRHDLIF
jgi:hypothetical protein